MAEGKMQSIGVCIGFDLITNNNDRFRLSKLWNTTNEGNICNVLIKIPNYFSSDRVKIRDREDTKV